MSDTSSDCYTCNFCDLIFNNQEDLDSHNQLHTSSGEFSCPLCKEVFPDLRLLQLHDLRHSLEETEEITNDPSSVFITFVRPAASFTCNICNEIFTSDEELIDHIAQHQDNMVLPPSVAEPDIVIKEESDTEYIPVEEKVYKVPPLKRPFKRTFKFSNYSDIDSPNECKTCMKLFNSFGSLRRHQRRFHSTKKTYTCTVCERSFSQLSLLSKHALLHHRTTKEEFECQICKKKFTKSMVLLKHIFITHACHDKHFCFACFKFFPNKEQLSHHMQDHIVSETFNCDKCKKRYKTEVKLKKHRCVSIGPRPYLCKVCGKRFLRLHHLERHCAMHKRKRETHKSDLAQNLKNKLIKTYDCIKCGKQFKTEMKLERHRCIYNGPRPYLCKICGKRFNRLYHLERHCTLHKQGSDDSDSDSFQKQDPSVYPDFDSNYGIECELPCPRKKFECYICSERYSSFKKYKQHFASQHEGVVFNSCHICSKQFSKSSKVKRHLITHTKGRNRMKPPPSKKRRASTERLACYQCPKTFVNKAGFQKHVLMHEKSKSGNFKCTICEKKFSEEKLLNEHILAFHDFFTDFQCNLCDTKFSSSYHLDQHMLSHSGLKRFKCFKCNTMFTTKIDLKKHILTHEETKPFPCYFCDKFFSRNYHRQKHLAVCAKDKRMRTNC